MNMNKQEKTKDVWPEPIIIKQEKNGYSAIKHSPFSPSPQIGDTYVFQSKMELIKFLRVYFTYSHSATLEGD